jgi:hypothetical protein
MAQSKFTGVPASARPGTAVSAPLLVKAVFSGVCAGFIVSLGVVFLLAIFHGEAIGLSPGACTFYACSMTMLLSQPAGIAGMVVGAVVGLVAGGVVYFVHHHLPRTS